MLILLVAKCFGTNRILKCMNGSILERSLLNANSAPRPFHQVEIEKSIIDGTLRTRFTSVISHFALRHFIGINSY